MNKIKAPILAVCILALSWYGMLCTHEMGHVIGAIMTGGSVQKVVLHPFSISRVDISPNPYPGTVVWLGPIIGSLFPSVAAWAVRQAGDPISKLLTFFAGFCLIANGAYIGLGAFGSVGDCGMMAVTGTPTWLMTLFGATALSAGLYAWHTLGRYAEAPSFLRAASIRATFVVVFATMLVGGLASFLPAD